MLMPFFSPPGISLEQVVSFQIDCKSLMAGGMIDSYLHPR